MKDHLSTLTTSFRGIPVSIATASLTLGDRRHLLNHLSIPIASCKVISGSLDRPNLIYSVQPVHTFHHKQKLEALHAFLLAKFGLRPESWRTQTRQSGIIYCATSDHCQHVEKALNATYGAGYAAVVYGEKNGMDKEMQRAAVRNWMDGHVQIFVATVCFPTIIFFPMG